MKSSSLERIVIAGGGTAGWMTAAALSKIFAKTHKIVLIESDVIGTVGVGEATIPTLHLFHDLLGVSEAEVMAATSATFKLGISFENWRKSHHQYIHSFGYLGRDHWAAGFQHFWLKAFNKGMASSIGDYCKEYVACEQGRFGVEPKQLRNHAFHLDATAYAKFLREYAESRGVQRLEGRIASVTKDVNGDIALLHLDSGMRVEGDLFIDCTGFRALLIEGEMHSGYDDWSHYLPCDRAVAVQTKSVDKPLTYTRSIAHEAGWQWRIPLQHRVGNGLVYCSKYLSDDDAKARLLANIEGELTSEPRVIKFQTGTRRSHWVKNCVAIGLSSGFLEPLESTSIHLIQRSIVRLIQLFPQGSVDDVIRDEFNRETRQEFEEVRDFIIAHYHVTERDDSDFWRYCRQMEIPETLRHRLALFTESGNIYKYGNELFGESSWLQVLIGQGLLPQSYHPAVDVMSDLELRRFMQTIRQTVIDQVAQLPEHDKFIAHYCPTKVASGVIS